MTQQDINRQSQGLPVEPHLIPDEIILFSMRRYHRIEQPLFLVEFSLSLKRRQSILSGIKVDVSKSLLSFNRAHSFFFEVPVD